MPKGFFQSIIKHYNKNPLYLSHFILSNANQQAYIYLSKWPKWYGNSCIIEGKEGTGKTYLSKIWQKKAGAYQIDLFNTTNKELEKHLRKEQSFVLDNFEKYFSRKSLLQNLRNHDFNIEETIIAIFDLCKNENKHLLLTSKTPIAELNIRMDDLKNRIISSNIFSLELPDEVSLNTYLIKIFSESQLKVSPDVTQYISKNVRRSFKEIDKIAHEIDSFSIEERRNITISLVKDVLSCRKVAAAL